MALQLDASPEELKLFLEEVEEHLQLLEEDLVRLEQEADNEDLLQEIFRAAHTLKGSSATIGHHTMAQLTHAMENILDKVRKNQLAITTDLANVLFEGLDVLGELKEQITAEEDMGIDITPILAKITAVAEGGAAPVQGSGPVQEVSPSQDVGQGPGVPTGTDLTWGEREKITEGLLQGSKCYRLVIALDPASDMLQVRAYITMMTLVEKGDLIKADPTMEDIEKEQAKETLEILYLTEITEDQLRFALSDLPDIKSVEITPFELEEAAVTMQGAPEESAVDTPQSGETGGAAAVVTAEAAAGRSEAAPAKNGSAQVLKKGSRTVRVDVELLDNLMNLVGELVIDRTRLFQILVELEALDQVADLTQELGRTSVHVGRVTTELQEQIMKARMLPVESLFNKFPRMMRDLAQKAGKPVNFVMEGQETELDRSIIEEIGDPLIHLLRNAVDHGLEKPEDREAAGKKKTGQIKLRAYHEENHIYITITDDGKGIDPEVVKSSAIKKGIITEELAKRLSDKEAINLVFASGLSTAAKVSEVSGRGVGMDVVRNNIEKINGAVEITTAIGKGSEFKIKLPLTLAIIRALLVSLGQSIYAIPLSSVTETIRTTRNRIETVNQQEVIVVRGKVLPLKRLGEIFGSKKRAAESNKIFVVVVNVGGDQLGLVVDTLVGEQEIVIKSLGKYIGDVRGISGATILGDGRVALIIDVPSLVKKIIS